MPELPEVEIVTRSLIPILKNKILTNFWTSDKNLRSQLSDYECFILTNKKVKRIFRQAKYLILELDNSWILIHFGMTGKITVSKVEQKVFIANNKHVHCSFQAEDNFLYFQDIRRFGGLYFVERSDEKNLFDSQLPFNFGIEPLSEKFNENYIYLISRKVNMPIKAWLMKGIIAGIGNIYASEALFRAGINPNAKTKSLGIIRMSRLVNSIKFVLTEAIRSGGSTINNYSNIDGEAGNYAKKHMVYGRKDKFCLICNYMLDTKYIAQRSSFYCKKCQKF